MTKSIKRFTAAFLAAVLVLTTLCTTAFAAGTITVSVSGSYGNKKVTYSYNVDATFKSSDTGFVTNEGKKIIYRNLLSDLRIRCDSIFL